MFKRRGRHAGPPRGPQRVVRRAGGSLAVAGLLAAAAFTGTDLAAGAPAPVVAAVTTGAPWLLGEAVRVAAEALRLGAGAAHAAARRG